MLKKETNQPKPSNNKTTTEIVTILFFISSCDFEKSVLIEKLFQDIIHNEDYSHFSPHNSFLDILWFY